MHRVLDELKLDHLVFRFLRTRSTGLFLRVSLSTQQKLWMRISSGEKPARSFDITSVASGRPVFERQKKPRSVANMAGSCSASDAAPIRWRPNCSSVEAYRAGGAHRRVAQLAIDGAGGSMARNSRAGLELLFIHSDSG